MMYPTYRWILPATSIVAAQAAASLILAAWLNIKLVPPFIDYVRESLAFASLFIGVALAAATIRLMRAKHPHPVSEIVRLAKVERFRIMAVLFGSILVMVQFSMLTWTKVVLPQTVGIWADPLLAHLDFTIFGRDAWQIFHLISADWIEIPYLAWFLVIVASIVWFICQPPSLSRDEAILSFLLCMSVVGMISIFLLPSGGPVFYERLGWGGRFAELPILTKTGMQVEYLWRVHTGVQTNVGAGISAMPSMHVALAFWLAYNSTHWKIAAWVFFALIFYGSVYLGWHYFTDGLAGAGGAWLCSKLVHAWLRSSTMQALPTEAVSALRGTTTYEN